MNFVDIITDAVAELRALTKCSIWCVPSAMNSSHPASKRNTGLTGGVLVQSGTPGQARGDKFLSAQLLLVRILAATFKNDCERHRSATLSAFLHLCKFPPGIF